MDFKITYISTDQRFDLYSFQEDNIQTYPLDEIENYESNIICIDEELNSSFSEEDLKKWKRFAPVIYKKIPRDKFELNSIISRSDFDQITKKWTFQNNLKIIEEFYPRINYLKDLASTNRLQFIEELHYLLVTQLTCSGAMIFFHDIEQKKDDEKESNSLIKKLIIGRKKTSMNIASEQEIMLFDYYKSHFIDEFNLIDLEISKNALTFSVLVNQSPLLMMIKISEFNSLQKSILEGLFRAFCS